MSAKFGLQLDAKQKLFPMASTKIDRRRGGCGGAKTFNQWLNLTVSPSLKFYVDMWICRGFARSSAVPITGFISLHE